ADAAERHATSEPGPRVHVWRALFTGVLLGIAAIVAGNLWIIHATSSDIVETVPAAPSRPVAIVLGNRVFPDGSMGADLEARVQVALDLYRAGKTKRLFLSGAGHPLTGYHEPGAMAAWLRRAGGPRG